MPGGIHPVRGFNVRLLLRSKRPGGEPKHEQYHEYTCAPISIREPVSPSVQVLGQHLGVCLIPLPQRCTAGKERIGRYTKSTYEPYKHQFISTSIASSLGAPLTTELTNSLLTSGPICACGVALTTSKSASFCSGVKSLAYLCANTNRL